MEARLKRFIDEYPLPPRPSKTHLYQLLQRDLSTIDEDAIAADIASNRFKNSFMFPNDVYFGVDLSSDLLYRGIDKYKDTQYETEYISAPVESSTIEMYRQDGQPRKIAVEGDILDTNLFPDNSLDVVVSTNTFNHLPETDYLSVVGSFYSYLSRGGDLFFNICVDLLSNEGTVPEIVDFLEDKFHSVDIFGYCNIISALYEELWLEDGEGNINKSKYKPIRYIQYAGVLLLSFLERVETIPSERMYFRCHGKKQI